MKVSSSYAVGALLSLCIAPSAHAICTTEVSGVINGDTWNSAGSPYCVTGDITVQSLSIIGAGVRVQFMGNHAFNVIGVLDAEGTESSRILFKADDSNSAGWHGIKLDNVPPGNRLVHVTIDGANNSALRILNSYPELDDIALINSSATNGGGLYLQLTTSNETLELRNCAINNNTSAGHGGGVYAIVASGALRIVDCQIQNNDATTGSENSAANGGGIYFEDAAYVEIVDSKISDNYTHSYNWCNSAYGHGGGIHMAKGTMVIRNTDISANTASSNANGCGDVGRSYGGGIYLSAGDATLINTIIDHNNADSSDGDTYEYGGGLYANNGRFALINSNVVYNIPEGIRNQDGLVEAVNCIVYGNQGDEIVDVVGGAAIVDYCLVEGGWPDGTGNLDCNPLFATPYDFHLTDGSCAIDTGDDAVPGLPTMDKDGAPRIIGAHVDLGAYEYQPPPPAYCGMVGDANGDGRITIADALLLARHVAGLPNDAAVCLISFAAAN